MESRYSVSTFIKNNGANHRRALIYIRITVNGKRAEISVKRSVDPIRWDSRANQIKGNKEDAKEINSLIDSLTLKVNRIYSRLVENDETISAEKIKKVFLGHEVTKKTLLEAFQIDNDAMKSRVGIDFSKSTFTRYSTTYDHIVQFLRQQYNK